MYRNPELDGPTAAEIDAMTPYQVITRFTGLGATRKVTVIADDFAKILRVHLAWTEFGAKHAICHRYCLDNGGKLLRLRMGPDWTILITTRYDA